MKWVNAHPFNQARHGLPTVMGTYVLSDPKTAFPLAVMDATFLTALRTGAAAGVATKHLAKLPLTRVGFIGCGVQARMFRDAHRTLGDFEIEAADLNRDAAERFVAESGGRVVSIEEAARCPVVCIATPSLTPVLMRSWIQPGTHINAMGADGPGKQELDPQILRDARIVVDEPDQSIHGGELNVPIAQGMFGPEIIAATLGDVIAKKAQGGAAPRRSQCSTRRAWRSRTWPWPARSTSGPRNAESEPGGPRSHPMTLCQPGSRGARKFCHFVVCPP